MKKILLNFIFAICLILPCAVVTGCNGENPPAEATYTVSFDYGKAGTFFKTNKTSTVVKENESVTEIPEIKDEYQNAFLGWFIKGTEEEFTSDKLINENVTVEAKFDVETLGLSGLYQNNKYVMNWDDFLNDYPDAFVQAGTEVVGSSVTGSYFSNLNGYLIIDSTIASVGDYAFSGCNGLTNIILPNSTTEVGDYAFANCDLLTSIHLPEGVISFGEGAFNDCDMLESINIPSDLQTIGSDAFSGCESLIKVNITGTEAIEKYCDISFANYYANPLCNGAKLYTNDELVTDVEFTLDNSKTVIKPYSFLGIDLKSITIHDGVTSIGDYAFYGCNKIESFTIPANLQSIGIQAFNGCESLATVQIKNNDSLAGYYNINFADYYANPSCYGAKLYSNGELLTDIEIVLDNTVTEIKPYAFMKMDLKSITIPESVVSIGDYAFYDCKLLTRIYYYSPSLTRALNENSNVFINAGQTKGGITLTIGSNVTIIPDYLFGAPNKDLYVKITKIDFTNATKLETIGNYAFNYCTKLKDITLPTSLKTIGDFAFNNCRAFTSIVIPNGVTSIGSDAFTYCNSATSVTIPESVTSIANNAFYNNKYLTEINYNAINLTTPLTEESSIFRYAGQSGTGITLNIGANVECIPAYLFYASKANYYSNIVAIDMSNTTKLTVIGEQAFPFCSGLTSVNIPSTVEEIGDYAFYKTGLTSIVLPDSLTNLGRRVFQECENLVSANVPKNVSVIKYGLFRYCTNLASVTIEGDVVDIQAAAFQDCLALTSINLPESIEWIRAGAFQGTSISSIVIPESVVYLGFCAFDTEVITSITFEDTEGWYLAEDMSGAHGDVVIEHEAIDENGYIITTDPEKNVIYMNEVFTEYYYLKKPLA